jgi:hypothetical protein
MRQDFMVEAEALGSLFMIVEAALEPFREIAADLDEAEVVKEPHQ